VGRAAVIPGPLVGLPHIAKGRISLPLHLAFLASPRLVSRFHLRNPRPGPVTR
jgi:hypothetical protein